MENTIEKSEILFLFESKYTIPNGDPFTGEQRYDEETKKVLVSDVRIKRYVRDYFIEQNFLFPNTFEVYVFNDKSQVAEGSKESGSSARMKSLWAKYIDKECAGQEMTDADKKKEAKKIMDALKKDKKLDKTALELLTGCIDVRLFGGISTEEGAAVNLTGPVQFALLNPSLNKSELRIHQNTSVFSSSADKSRGSIGTTTVVPYAINQIQGWVNPYSGKLSGLETKDINDLFKAMWNSVNNINTRSKSNQSSVLMLQIVYKEATDKLYGTDRLIGIESEKEDEQIRSMEDYTLNFEKLKAITSSPKIKEIRFYTEIESIKNELKGDKFKEMTL
ncbi:type I-B CRISPR-associated protein Cas7/Csh2 [Labilibaculum sp.]|uniref:type I-B CRISPR-associated protein Cas7/Csh2 n=1 Tax=Labilibaculum sp. TaxID=2060723 RepID=UPI002AA64B04|nr:type I-B CRISPR-associated protein Cas7/Csh2 [Labilibaculum sp.]